MGPRRRSWPWACCFQSRGECLIGRIPCPILPQAILAQPHQQSAGKTGDVNICIGDWGGWTGLQYTGGTCAAVLLPRSSVNLLNCSTGEHQWLTRSRSTTPASAVLSACGLAPPMCWKWCPGRGTTKPAWSPQPPAPKTVLAANAVKPLAPPISWASASIWAPKPPAAWAWLTKQVGLQFSLEIACSLKPLPP